MYKQEEIKPYNNKGDKREQVEKMFDNIASTYDALNHRLSWNIDKIWRRKAILQLIPFSPKRILDIATGTGDFAIQSAKMLKPKTLIGADISVGMMNIGKEKVIREKLDDIIIFQQEDCLNLSFNNDSFDAVTVAFGIRNFAKLDDCLKELYRVLNTEGHLCIVELSHPVSFPMKHLFTLYSHTILPLYARIVSKDKNAYRYLISTIEAFPQGERMTMILAKVGFKEIKFKRLTFGICTMYIATK